MKAKQIIKTCTDAAMYVLFLLLMEQHLIADAAHEWMGIAVFALFLLHNALNYRWYAALFKGRYNCLRVVQTAINFLLWLAMLGCIVSSLMISGTVFSGLVIPGSRYGAMIHMVCTAWVFVLMSLHLGLHWAQFTTMARRVNLNANLRAAVVWALRAVALAICAVGVWVFIDRAFYEELFLISEYKMYDYDANAFVYILETAALSVMFVSAAYYGKKLRLFFLQKHKEAKT